MIDFEPNEDQLNIRDMARKFASEVIRPAETALDKLSDSDEVYRSQLFQDTIKQAYNLGFHNMTINEAHGGLGLDPLTTALVWEELAVGGVGIPATLLAGSVAPAFLSILAGDRKELIDKYVRPYCADSEGKIISAWGSSEGDIGSDGSNYYDKSVRHETTAVRDGNGWIINGAKSSFVSNGSIAEMFLVFACVNPEQGICGSGVFLVPFGEGVTRGKAMDKLGMRVLNQGEVVFDNVRVPEDHLIMLPGENYPFIHNAIKTVGNLGVGYLALGLMRAAYEEALSHAKERVQFGKPLIHHQAMAFKLFECFQAIEAARGLLWKASWTLAKQFMGDLKISAAARVFATNMAMKHTVEMVQILGGYGISREYSIEKFMRDAKLLQIMDATNEIMTIKGSALL